MGRTKNLLLGMLPANMSEGRHFFPGIVWAELAVEIGVIQLAVTQLSPLPYNSQTKACLRDTPKVPVFCNPLSMTELIRPTVLGEGTGMHSRCGRMILFPK